MSSDLLQDFRQHQSDILRKRLSVFKASLINQYGSLDKVPKNKHLPLDSQGDAKFIEKICDIKTFVVLPIFDEKGITHVYTVGLWYYWGLPELVIQFDEPLRENPNFINMIVNIIHVTLFDKFSDKILSAEKDENGVQMITRNDFDDETIQINRHEIEFDFKKVDGNEYMELNAGYMMWFYMYYMDAQCDDDSEPKMYPVYKLDISKNNFLANSKLLIDSMLQDAINKTEKLNLNDDNSEISVESDEESDDYKSDDDAEPQRVPEKAPKKKELTCFMCEVGECNHKPASK